MLYLRERKDLEGKKIVHYLIHISDKITEIHQSLFNVTKWEINSRVFNKQYYLIT